jgi:RNA polymerase sigma factor (sigma-70 family)
LGTIMASTVTSVVLRQLRALAAEQAEHLSDRRLLEHFTACRDGEAFAVLMKRHGPMVLSVCRRVLDNTPDADDAFQATFLALARRAGAVGRRGAVGGWLYRVAYRAAIKAKSCNRKRQKYERQAAPRRPADLLEEVTGRELLAVLDEELHQLPERWRAPLVACYLEGKTRDEAAGLFGWSASTLQRRLEKARQRLGARLARRGLGLPATLLSLGLAQVMVPQHLTAAALAAARAVGAEGSAALANTPAAALAEAALRGTRVFQLRTILAVLLTAGVLAGASLTFAPPAAAPREDAKSAAPHEATKILSGRVLDPDGNPAADAEVAVLAEVSRLQRYGGLSRQREVLRRTRTDSGGHFRLSLSSGAAITSGGLVVVATHLGHSLTWQVINADGERADQTLHLRRERLLRGRLVDLQGQPAAKVVLCVTFVGREGGGLSEPATDLPAWPGPVVTDAEGRFVLRDLSEDDEVTLQVRDDRFARQQLQVPRGRGQAREITFALSPPRLLTGRVTFADTGRPAGGVEVLAWGVRGRTDAEGRFRLNAAQGPLRAAGESTGGEVGTLIALAPEREPYVHIQRDFRWPRGEIHYSIDVALPRGVLVRGRVAEVGGKAVAGAQVQYFAQTFNNPNLKPEDTSGNNFANGRNAVTTAADGTFQIACLPGPGYLLVEGPDADYVLRENGGQERLFRGRRGGQPWWSHGFEALDLQRGGEPQQAAITLRKGVTLQGEAVGPDGQPAGDLQVFCRLEGFATRPVMVRGHCFELHGCDPSAEMPVMLLDAKNRTGATMKVSDPESAKPILVRLLPCGSARVRFLDRERRPLADFYPGLFLVLAPAQAGLDAQTFMIASPFRKAGPHTDGEGYCILEGLIPGASYQFGYASAGTPFTAQAGKTSNLPDVVLDDVPR